MNSICHLNIFLFFCFLPIQQLDYRWVQTGSWVTDSRISSLSWNLEGNRLLTGGNVLQLWHQRINQGNEPEIGF